MFINYMEDIETAMEIAKIPRAKTYMDSMRLEIEDLRKRLNDLNREIDDDEKPITKIPCPWCGELPTMVQEDVVGLSGLEEGWAVNCSNQKCGALGPIRRYRKPAIAAWEKRAKAKK